MEHLHQFISIIRKAHRPPSAQQLFYLGLDYSRGKPNEDSDYPSVSLGRGGHRLTFRTCHKGAVALLELHELELDEASEQIEQLLGEATERRQDWSAWSRSQWDSRNFEFQGKEEYLVIQVDPSSPGSCFLYWFIQDDPEDWRALPFATRDFFWDFAYLRRLHRSQEMSLG